MTTPDKPQAFTEPEEVREDRRFRTELPVLVNTLMSDQSGWVVDVSRQGMKIHGIKAPPRSRVFVHYRGHLAEGMVRWSMPGQSLVGVVLDTPLRTGPLAEIWQRFQENVQAFGKYSKGPRPPFGRKQA